MIQVKVVANHVLYLIKLFLFAQVVPFSLRATKLYMYTGHTLKKLHVF